MKELLTIAGMVILLTAFLMWSASDFNGKYDKNKLEYQNLVGEKVVVGKDTLIITDYSMLQGKFYLNNGTEISKEYAQKQVIHRAALSN